MQPQSEAELAEGESPRRRRTEPNRARRGGHADFGIGEHLDEERLEPQAREGERVEEQAAGAERIVGGPAPAFAHARELARLALESERCRRHQAVERIVHPHRRHERPRKIDTHFPVKPRRRARRVGESAMRRLRQLERPAVIALLARDPRSALERVQPLGKVVVVLAVALPFQLGVEGLVGRALG